MKKAFIFLVCLSLYYSFIQPLLERESKFLVYIALICVVLFYVFKKR